MPNIVTSDPDNIVTAGGFKIVADSGTIGKIVSTGKKIVDGPDVGDAPLFIVDPVLSGDTDIGDLLTTTNGTVTGTATITYSYDWLRDGVSIGATDQNTYTIVMADEGTDITVEITATNAFGFDYATSNALNISCPNAINDTLLLDGVDQYILVADSASLDSANISYGGWYYIDSAASGNQRLMNRWTNSSSQAFGSFYNSSGNVLAWISTNGSNSNTVSFAQSKGEWFHMMFTYDGTTGRLYLNGSEVGTSIALSGNISASSKALSVGSLSTGSGVLDGSIGPQFLFSSALSVPEIVTLYNGGVGKQPAEFDSAIKAKYLMALPINDGDANPEDDVSGNGNDATLINTPTYTGETLEFTGNCNPETFNILTEDNFFILTEDNSNILLEG